MADRAIVFTRVSDGWRVEIPGEQVRRARSLSRLYRRVRDRGDLAGTAVRFETGDPVLDRCACTIRAAQEVAHNAEQITRALVDLALSRADGRLSQRETAIVVNLSHQRLSQLRRHRSALDQDGEMRRAIESPVTDRGCW